MQGPDRLGRWRSANSAIAKFRPITGGATVEYRKASSIGIPEPSSFRLPRGRRSIATERREPIIDEQLLDFG